MNLSVETKVAIAVATSFVVLMVGAMAQGSERGCLTSAFLARALKSIGREKSE